MTMSDTTPAPALLSPSLPLAGSGAAAEVAEVEVKVTTVPSTVWITDSTRVAGLFVTAAAIWSEIELVTLL